MEYARGEFVRLADVDHRPGASADGLFEVIKIDNVRIGPGPERENKLNDILPPEVTLAASALGAANCV